MKTFYYALVVFIFISCGKSHMQSPLHATHICAVYDITELLTSPPVVDPILKLFDFQNDKDQQVGFRLVLLQGTLLNPIQDVNSYGLTNEKKTTNEEIELHNKLVHSFCNAIRTAVTDFPKGFRGNKSPARTECFATIAQELELLANSTASQRVLIVFGSLSENTPIFSSRSLHGKKLLKTNAKKVVELLQKRRRLPNNLVGISVYFVFQPNNGEDAAQYREIAGIYRNLLRERGARVIIQSTNTKFEP